MAEPIKSTMIIEMLGRPPEHITEFIGQVIDKIDAEKGIKILDKKVHEPKKVEPQEGQPDQGIYSIFAEIDFEAAEILDLVRVCFTYMPSHVEVLNPSSINMQNTDLGATLNEIGSRMHKYDAIAKTAMMEVRNLQHQLKEAKGEDKKEEEDKKD